ncbi:hypothetical protein LTR85_010033 [Meristemomyces frigidus]|nr:hypothetical protein LTR85_010033 [Meristemomyces frigidus]
MKPTLGHEFSKMRLTDSAQYTGSINAVANVPAPLTRADLSAAFALLQLRRESNAILHRVRHLQDYRPTLANMPIHPRFFNKPSRSRAAYKLQNDRGVGGREASWGPHYFTGMPLGTYCQATVLPKVPGLKKDTVLGEAVGRRIITEDEIYADMFNFATDIDPKKAGHGPNFMLMAPITEISENELLDLAMPAELTIPKPKISPSMQGVLDKWEASGTKSIASTPVSFTNDNKKRKRAATPESEDGEDEVVVAPKRLMKRKAVSLAPEEQDDEMDQDEKLARALQFEVNYGSRKRERHLRRGEILRSL